MPKVNSNKIKALLKLNGFTYEPLRKKLKMSKSSFNNRINGESNFSAVELKAVADFLGVKVDELYNN